MSRVPQGDESGLAEEWHDSAHGEKGINCYDCHKANKNDPGAFDHNGR